MTTVATAPTRRVRVRAWWADMVEGAVYLTVALGLAFFLADGGILTYQPIDLVYSAGRALGIVAAVLVMAQVLLISRAPWIDRAIGHDRAAAMHTRWGKWAVIMMAAHAGVITLMSGYYESRPVWEQSVHFFTASWFMAAAQIGLAAFALVFATSLLIVRRRWRYETWHAVHLLTYVGVAAAVPHQFLEGSTFRDGGAGWWFWLIAYVVAFGTLIAFRVAAPVWRLWRHDLRVDEVVAHPDGSTSITMRGRGLAGWRSLPGQFFLWRFLDRERWAEAHPFSLSRAATADSVRITVKPAGDGSAALATVQPGTRVMAEGPLGVFSSVARTKPGAVLVAAGIGITPLRAMLDDIDDAGPLDVVWRVRSRAEAPLLDEVEAICADRGIALHLVEGPRGVGWAARARDVTLADLVPDVAERDVYVCGPPAWADAVHDDAIASGVDRDSIHRERFGWTGDER